MANRFNRGDCSIRIYRSVSFTSLRVQISGQAMPDWPDRLRWPWMCTCVCTLYRNGMRAWQCLHSSTSACVACALSIHDEEFAIGRDGIGAIILIACLSIPMYTCRWFSSISCKGRGIMITTITAPHTLHHQQVYRGINRQAIGCII